MVDRRKLSRYPLLWVDSGELRHGIGWQRRPASEGGACFALVRLSDLVGIKAIERFPLTEDGWARAWRSLVQRDPASAQAILRILARRDSDTSNKAELARLDAESITVLLGDLPRRLRAGR